VQRSDRIAVIIGAGPAGLTAAYELLTRACIRPIVLERSTYLGGISRTINYKNNRMDMGGHRYALAMPKSWDECHSKPCQAAIGRHI
jgi:protoporphyrinogen oxidase